MSALVRATQNAFLRNITTSYKETISQCSSASSTIIRHCKAENQQATILIRNRSISKRLSSDNLKLKHPLDAFYQLDLFVTAKQNRLIAKATFSFSHFEE